MKDLKEKDLECPEPSSHQRRSWHTRPISVLAVVGALALLNGCFRGTEPALYALCSPHGTANIYTVDANDTKAQCLVVKGERFLHTNAYGEYVKTPRFSEGLTRAFR